jgi:hypothetical protein
MKNIQRILTVAALAYGFAFAANGAILATVDSLQADTLAGCGGCGKDKKEGDDKGKGECPKKDGQTSAFQDNTAQVLACGGCDKDKKEGDGKGKGETPKKDGQTSAFQDNGARVMACGGCDKDKKEGDGKGKGECPSGGDKKS